MQHFLKIGGKRYGEVRNFKKVRKFASSNLKFRSSKFKFTEILICNPGTPRGDGGREPNLPCSPATSYIPCHAGLLLPRQPELRADVAADAPPARAAPLAAAHAGDRRAVADRPQILGEPDARAYVVGRDRHLVPAGPSSVMRLPKL